MKITVKDCLELSAFRPCTIATGKDSLDNIVRSVSVMDAMDVKTALKENGIREQMVLASFYGMKGIDLFRGLTIALALGRLERVVK